MPYRIRKVKGRYCVYSPKGRRGCSATLAKAKAMIRVIRAKTGE